MHLYSLLYSFLFCQAAAPPCIIFLDVGWWGKGYSSTPLLLSARWVPCFFWFGGARPPSPPVPKTQNPSLFSCLKGAGGRVAFFFKRREEKRREKRKPNLKKTAYSSYILKEISNPKKIKICVSDRSFNHINKTKKKNISLFINERAKARNLLIGRGQKNLSFFKLFPPPPFI